MEEFLQEVEAVVVQELQSERCKIPVQPVPMHTLAHSLAAS